MSFVALVLTLVVCLSVCLSVLSTLGRFFQNPGERQFKLTIEDTVFDNVDIVALGGGVSHRAVSLETAAVVSDGFLSIAVEDTFPKVDQGKISGILIRLLGPHLAHSVANGPYRAVDIDGDGFADVPVDGSPSHTHGTGLTLDQWIWREGPTVVGTAATTSLRLAVGDHDVGLTVIDDGFNEHTDFTTITVLPFGYPAVTTISPNSGSIAGGNIVTITGSGFTYTAEETIVHFGLTDLTGSSLNIIDEFTIQLQAPATVVGVPVQVSVTTPLEESNAKPYNFISSTEINFDTTNLNIPIDSPTSVKFGPDRNLYVGSINGQLGKFTLNEDYTEIVDSVITTVAQFRCIIGIAFDPLDNSTVPDVYITTSFFFHGSSTSSSGDSINGEIAVIRGANLDEEPEVIVSGIPVSDHDHGVTALEFGNNGELYYGVGSNTNGGIPGTCFADMSKHRTKKAHSNVFAVYRTTDGEPDSKRRIFLRSDQRRTSCRPRL